MSRKPEPHRDAGRPKVASRGSPTPKPAPKPGKPAAKPVPKTAPKSSPKPPVKPAAKPAPKKPVVVRAPEPAKSGKPAAAPAKPAAAPTKGAPAPAAADPSKIARKGITIVTPRPVRRPRPKAQIVPVPPGVGGLMAKGISRKPLIPSGPKASTQTPLGVQHAAAAVHVPPKLKTPFNKKELERFRAILMRKRAELVGDINNMESQALKDQSGSLSNLPQHIAEQGSEAYEQSLALDLAAADRKLIKEIDDALKRIDDGTYGVCERTGKPIKAERLEELPWARYSIEAAREIERRHMRN